MGYGAWAIGGTGWEFAWGSQSGQDSIAAIHRALDLGSNWIDTAAVYGLGHSEAVIAQALKERSEQPYVRSPGEVAIAWTLKHPAVTGAIVGGRNAEQIEGTIGAADLHLSADDLSRIKTFLQENP